MEVTRTFPHEVWTIEARALDIRTTARQKPRNFKSREELEEGSTIDG
jgi:hypothetical protein